MVFRAAAKPPVVSWFIFFKSEYFFKINGGSIFAGEVENEFGFPAKNLCFRWKKSICYRRRIFLSAE
jgi:hypothetical protein